MAGIDVVYVEQMLTQATRLDQEADAVRAMHDAWKKSTGSMDDALPEAASRASYDEAVQSVEARMTELESALRSWGAGFRRAAEVYRSSDTLAAYRIAHPVVPNPAAALPGDPA